MSSSERNTSSDGAGIFDESVKDVITESEVQAVPAGARLLIREGALITPLALDLLRSRGIEVRRKPSRRPEGERRLIAIGADHGGFAAKGAIVAMLTELGYRCRDFGTRNEDPVDYPNIAHEVARAVADGSCDLGILFDGAGIGSCMVANKVPGIRAAMCYDEASARNSREHNYANVLTLGARMLPAEMLGRIVRVWLETPQGEARHGRRVAMISAIEKQYLR